MLRSRLSSSVLAILAALALIAAACGGSDAAVAADAGEDAPAPAAAEAPATEDAPAAPAISLTASTISGGQIDFASLEGQDVVLWFWAPW